MPEGQAMCPTLSVETVRGMSTRREWDGPPTMEDDVEGVVGREAASAASAAAQMSSTMSMRAGCASGWSRWPTRSIWQPPPHERHVIRLTRSYEDDYVHARDNLTPQFVEHQALGIDWTY